MRTSRRFVAQLLVVVAGLVAAGCTTTAEVEQSQPIDSIAVATPAVAEDSPSAEEVAEVRDGATEAAVTAPASPPAGRAGTRTTVVDDIRAVDFENGFTYHDAAFGDLTATVTDGEYANGEFGDDEYFWFAVTDVSYGDLDGDGIEEAVVSTGYSGGGSGFFENVRAFKLVDGTVAEAGIVYFGDRAFGGIGDIFIRDGIVSVLMFTNGEGSCCANEAAIVRLVLGDHFLTEADSQQNLAWSSLSQFEERRLMKFLPNTSGAYASMWPDDLESSFALEAFPGQVLTIEVVDGPAPTEVIISDGSTGERVGQGASAVLPSDAIYEVDIRFDDVRQESTTLLVQIDAESAAISWVPRTEQTVVSTNPVVRSALTWPEFSSETADVASLAAANQWVALAASSIDDLWVDDVTEFPPLPDQESNFELVYEVTYAADDLVSVRYDFYDYVCCRAHPNYGPIAEVVDLRHGRPVPVAEIFDLGRIDEIHALWVAGLEAQGEFPTEVLDALDDVNTTEFQSVGLVPEGIELGTGRGVISGGSPGTLVVLTFEDLGDLVQPDFLARLGRT